MNILFFNAKNAAANSSIHGKPYHMIVCNSDLHTHSITRKGRIYGQKSNDLNSRIKSQRIKMFENPLTSIKQKIKKYDIMHKYRAAVIKRSKNFERSKAFISVNIGLSRLPVYEQINSFMIKIIFVTYM